MAHHRCGFEINNERLLLCKLNFCAPQKENSYRVKVKFKFTWLGQWSSSYKVDWFWVVDLSIFQVYSLGRKRIDQVVMILLSLLTDSIGTVRLFLCSQIRFREQWVSQLTNEEFRLREICQSVLSWVRMQYTETLEIQGPIICVLEPRGVEGNA